MRGRLEDRIVIWDSNFEELVRGGCLEAVFLRPNTQWKARD